jgi:hypothetical protein
MLNSDVGGFLKNFETRFCTKKYNKDATKTAVLIESRKAYFLPHVIKSVLANIDDDVNLHIFSPPNILTWLGSTFPKVEFQKTSLELEGRHLNISQLNKLLLSQQFWKCIQTEKVLLFQLDSIMLRPVPIESWNHDFIGAPCGTLDPKEFIMNGGFSIRNKTFILNTLKEHEDELKEFTENEDVFFSKHCTNKPSLEACIAFCTESVPHLQCVGIHGTDKYYVADEVMRELLLYRSGELAAEERMLSSSATSTNQGQDSGIPPKS